VVTALKLTVHQLDALPDDGQRYELIDGELLVSKAPGIPHQRSLGRLFVRLSNSLAESRAGEVLLTPGIVFGDYDAVIPDLVVVTAGREVIITDRGLIDAPDLVVEVVSAGEKNGERDRQIKRQLYSRHGVREYWILDPALKAIEVYRRKENVLVLDATLRGSDSLISQLVPGFFCVVSDIFD
jgi:Uma2 family endonuclease